MQAVGVQIMRPPSIYTDKNGIFVSIYLEDLMLGPGFHSSNSIHQLAGKEEELFIRDVLSPRHAMNFVISAEIGSVLIEDRSRTILVITALSGRIEIDPYTACYHGSITGACQTT